MNLNTYKTSKKQSHFGVMACFWKVFFAVENIRKKGMETSLTNVKTNDKGSTRDSVMQKRQ